MATQMPGTGMYVAGATLVAFLIAGGIVYAKIVDIEPGHVGVSVEKCGGGGVKPEPLPSGYHSRSLFCEKIIEYPISLQTLVLTRASNEGSENDDSITVTSSEGLPINVDCSLSFTLDPARVPEIYTKYRADIEYIESVFIRQTVREGLQQVYAEYTAEELYSTKRETARLEVQKFLTDRLGQDGFLVAQFTINETRVPDQVVQAINGKVAMIQDAQKAEQEVKKTEALADQEVAQAEGQAKAKRALADAEAYYNETVAKSLTPEFVQYEAILKWNGQLPQMTGGGAIPFVNLKPADAATGASGSSSQGQQGQAESAP